MSNHSLVLRHETTLTEAMDAVRRAVTELNGALPAEWYYAQLDELDGMRVCTWVEPLHGYGTIRLNEDPFVPTLYVSFEAVPQVRSAVEAALRRHVQPVSEAELQADVERAFPARTTALMRLGIGEERAFDERTAQLLVAALESAEVEERRAATMGMFLLPWCAFVPAIERAITRESVVSLREQLAYALALRRGDISL